MFIRYFAVITAGVAFALLIWLRSQQATETIALTHAVELTAPDVQDVTAPVTMAQPPTPELSQSVEPTPALRWVADDFEQQVQFPEQSRPIADREAVKKYLPNRSTPIMRELPSGLFELTTDHLRYSPEQAITGIVSVPDTLADPQLSLTLVQDGAELDRLPISLSSGTRAFAFAPPGQSWQQEQIFVVATITGAGQETVTLSTPILRDDRSESFAVSNTGESYVDGAWLMIPVDLSTEQAGFYRLEANLYSAVSGEPLIHLMSEAELNSGRSEILLRAHIQALQHKGEAGDYLLADLVLEKMPGPPDFEVTQGKVPLEPIPVQGYPFSDYNDEAYIDADALARLEFLRSLSQ